MIWVVMVRVGVVVGGEGMGEGGFFSFFHVMSDDLLVDLIFFCFFVRSLRTDMDIYVKVL